MSDILPILLIAAVILFLGAAVERRRMQQFWSRGCMGAKWRRSFPEAPKAEIRAFLDLILEAFGFREAKRLRFAPEDQIMAIYRALYPRAPRGGDGMELESFLEAVQERYGVDLLPFWRDDITLGELFSHATGSR